MHFSPGEGPWKDLVGALPSVTVVNHLSSPQPAALLTYERAALGGGDDEAQGDGRLGDAGAGHQALQILLELGADQGERLQ